MLQSQVTPKKEGSSVRRLETPCKLPLHRSVECIGTGLNIHRLPAVVVSSEWGCQIRVFRVTTVKEARKIGAPRDVHLSVRLPSSASDLSKLWGAEGFRTGESFAKSGIRQADCGLDHRSCSTSLGVQRV